MALISDLVSWTEATFAPLGSLGIFVLAFIESSFFPIPPDLLLIVLSLAKPEAALLYALIATIGSTLGGMFGYLIGYVGEKTLLLRFFSEQKIKRVHDMFNKYEAWAIFIAAFTPIPYKVFTIAAGVFYVDLWKFIIASFIGRGLRFFSVAILIMYFGNFIVELIDKYFDILSIAGVAVLIAGYYGYKKFGRKSK